MGTQEIVNVPVLHGPEGGLAIVEWTTNCYVPRHGGRSDSEYPVVHIATGTALSNSLSKQVENVIDLNKRADWTSVDITTPAHVVAIRRVFDRAPQYELTGLMCIAIATKLSIERERVGHV
jgi:hypothetical protein